MRSALLSILFSLSAVICTANASTAKESAIDADSQSKPVIKDICKFYKSLGAISFSAGETVKGKTDSSQYSVKMKRSPLLFALMSNDRDRGWAISGGKSLVIYTPVGNLYQESSAAKQMSDICNAPSYLRLVTSGTDWLWERLLDANPSDAIDSAFSKATYIGQEEVGNHKCHHLQLTYKKAIWDDTFRFAGQQNDRKIVWSPKDIWVDTGTQPWLRQEASTSSVTTITYAAKPLTSVTESTVVDLYDNYQLNPTFSAGDFQFTPPQTAQLVSDVENSLEYDEAVQSRGNELPANK